MIPFVDLQGQFQGLKDEVLREMEQVATRADFILGDAVARFEDEFAAFCGTRYCVGVASGTDALHLALIACGIGAGDEVITASNTFVATVLAVSYAGATPVLVDTDPATYNLDLEQVRKKITPRTKAIIPVHLYGRAVDMDAVGKLAREHGLLVIEDACQAHGARWKDARCGAFGAIGCFSFYPGKNLGAYGDGGALTTSDSGLYERLKMLRNYGSPKKYHHDFIGYNSRLDTMQAAILRVKLRRLEEWNRQRYANAQAYNKALKGVGDLVLPELCGERSHVFHLYVVRTKQRDALMKHLTSSGIQCGIHYPVPIYALKAYAHLGVSPSDFPVTDAFSRDILSLPMFPELTQQQIGEVSGAVKKFFGG